MSSTDEESKVKTVFKMLVKVIIAWIFVIGLVMVYLFITIHGYFNEGMEDQFILNQLAAENADPVYFKYTGRDRDVLGMSGEDYYYANLTYGNSQASDQLLEGNSAFINQTDYLDMPAQYRPKPLSGFVGNSGNVVASESASD